MKWIWIATILILMSSFSLGAVLIGAECPSTIYQHELTACRGYITTTGEEGTIYIYPHSANGLFEAEQPVIEINLEPAAISEVNINIWASEIGKDALILDYSFSGRKGSSITEVNISGAPILVSVPQISGEAGKRKDFTVKIQGTAVDVNLWEETTTPTVETSPPVRIGALDGSAEADFYIIPSPHYIGKLPLFIYVSFKDETGTHVLKYETDIWINPSFGMITAFGAGFILIVGLAYLAYKSYKRKRHKKKPNEAQ